MKLRTLNKGPLKRVYIILDLQVLSHWHTIYTYVHLDKADVQLVRNWMRDTCTTHTAKTPIYTNKAYTITTHTHTHYTLIQGFGQCCRVLKSISEAWSARLTITFTLFRWLVGEFYRREICKEIRQGGGGGGLKAHRVKHEIIGWCTLRMA